MGGRDGLAMQNDNVVIARRNAGFALQPGGFQRGAIHLLTSLAFHAVLIRSSPIRPYPQARRLAP